METPITELEQRVDDLQKKAAGPTAELEQVRAELEAAREAEAARQAARGEDWERAFLDSWEERDAQLQAEEREIRADFIKAIENDPVWSAWIRLRGNWSRRNAIRSTAEGARYREAARRGEPSTHGGVPLLSYREPTRLYEEILNAVRDQEQQAGSAETERHQAEREAYMKGDS